MRRPRSSSGLVVSNNTIVKVNYLRLNRGKWLHSYEETKVQLGPAK